MTDMKTNVASPLPADVRQQAQDWLLRLNGAAVSEADADAFRRWRGLDPRHAAAFAQARALWKALGPALQATGAQAEQAPVAREEQPVASPPPAAHAGSPARPRS
ncbi:FecR/PupR family sigma factor regulator, partial [Stenotrophomonas indicatrix]